MTKSKSLSLFTVVMENNEDSSVTITFYTVEELQKEGAKALEIDKGIVQNGPIELKEEDNYVMCK